jgi:hypothetical protein
VELNSIVFSPSLATKDVPLLFVGEMEAPNGRNQPDRLAQATRKAEGERKAAEAARRAEEARRAIGSPKSARERFEAMRKAQEQIEDAARKLREQSRVNKP